MRLLLTTGLILVVLASACTKEKETPAFSQPEQVINVFALKNEFIPQEIKVKALLNIKLAVTSFDDEYYIEIPGLGISRTKIPARERVVITFTPIDVGSYEFRNPLVRGMTGTINVQVCPPEAEVANPIASSPASIAVGKEVYSAKCVSCHGTSGQGDGPAVKEPGSKPIDFTQPFMANISDGEMFWIIGEGWYGMPSFKDKLTDEQRWHVINYIRTFATH